MPPVVVEAGRHLVGVASRPQRRGGLWRLMIVLGTAALVVAGGLIAGLDGSRTRSAIEAARHQNTALKARQAILRERDLDLAQRWIAIGESEAAVRSPAGRETQPVRDAAALRVADRGSAGRQNTAPTTGPRTSTHP